MGRERMKKSLPVHSAKVPLLMKGPHIRSPVEFEAAFVLNVEHQITPIEKLHHEEQVFLEWERK